MVSGQVARTLTTSFTPRLTYFAVDAFFTNLYSFFVNFLLASGFEIGETAFSLSS
jgi:hypothetical protein